jgi:hypothetical protein
MKKILFLSLVLLILTSCGRKFNMRVCSGEDVAYTETWIECDSFQMNTAFEADIWVDGQKLHIIGNRGIKPETK